MRKSLTLGLGIALLLTIVTLSVTAEDNKDDQQSANLESLSWMVGHWQGNAFGGTCEEVWSPASAGTMTGTFKLSVNDEVKFYELMVLSIIDSGPTLRLKHFNADMTGWEEKDKVITFAFKYLVWAYANFDIKVARGGAVHTRLALTGQPDTVTIIHTRWYFH